MNQSRAAILKFGLIGLGVTLLVNLLGIYVFPKPAAELFTADWWSAWFPPYSVWIVFTVVGMRLWHRARGMGGE